MVLSSSHVGSSYYSNYGQSDLITVGLNGIIRSLHVQFFNSENTILAAVRYNKGKEILADSEQMILYGRTGNITEERIAGKDGQLHARKLYVYNNGNQLAEINQYDNENTLCEKWIFHYDTYGRKTEQYIMLQPSTLIDKWTFNYDYTGNVTEEKKFRNGILLERWVYKTQLNSTEINRYISDNLLNERWVFNHNAKGMAISALRYVQMNLLFEKYTFLYDVKGNILEKAVENLIEHSFKRYRFEYKYDQSSNWTCRTEYIDNEPFMMVKRNIKYGG